MHGFDSTQMAQPSAVKSFEESIKNCTGTQTETVFRKSRNPWFTPSTLWGDGAPIQFRQQSINAACCQPFLVHLHKFVALRTQNKVGSINIEALCLKLLISLATLHTEQNSLSPINIQGKASVRTANVVISGDNRKQMSVLNIWSNCFMVGYAIVALINFLLMKLINGKPVPVTSEILLIVFLKKSWEVSLWQKELIRVKLGTNEMIMLHLCFHMNVDTFCAHVWWNVGINPWLKLFVFTSSLTLICFDKRTAWTKTGKQKWL